MIVLGWMLFVGLASYMGTFPEMMVSTSLAPSYSGLGFMLPSGISDQTGKVVEVFTNWKSGCDRNISSHWGTLLWRV